MQVALLIANEKPLDLIFKGILSAHDSFKTKPKNKNDIHNKIRLPNMRWREELIGEIETIPLRVIREKPTLKKKKAWE